MDINLIKTNSPQHRQQGAALITALFIMALVAIAATAMSIRLAIGIRSTELTTHATQLYLAAEGVKYWGISTLTKDAQIKISQKNARGRKGETDVTLDKLPQSFGPINETGSRIQISGTLFSEQGKFNINNLSNKNYIPQFIVLLKNIEPNLSNNKAKAITNAISDWVSTKHSIRASDQYTEAYAKRNPPYQAAFIPMVSISELRLVSGITSALYQKLIPFVTALPYITKIDINAAPKVVLMSLGAGLSSSQANALIAFRKNLNGFKNLKPFTSNSEIKKMKIPKSEVTLNSRFFMTKAFANQEKQKIMLSMLFERQIIRGKVMIMIVSQEEM